MPRHSRGVMSDALKYELARELGVWDVVSHEGWGGVSSRNCGNLVRLAVQKAEIALVARYGTAPTLMGAGAWMRTGG